MFFLLAIVMRNLATDFGMNKTKKNIKSRNVIFSEQVMYKDRSTVVLDVIEIDQNKSKFVNLDELTENTVQKGVKKKRKI